MSDLSVKENLDILVKKEQLTSDDLKTLLDAREKGLVNFSLIDVREPFEFQMANIKGTDELLPTSSFYDWINKIQDRKDENIILYCRTGNRSYQVQQILKQQGFKTVGNLTYGIVDYDGEIIQG